MLLSTSVTFLDRDPVERQIARRTDVQDPELGGAGTLNDGAVALDHDAPRHLREAGHPSRQDWPTHIRRRRGGAAATRVALTSAIGSASLILLS